MEININEKNLNAVKSLENGVYLFDAKSGHISLPELMTAKSRYFAFKLEMLENHSGTFQLLYYAKGEEEPRFTIRFGVLPNFETQFCFDLNWLDGHVLFPGNTPGALKLVCHGSRISPEEIQRVEFSSYPCFHDINVKLTDLKLLDEMPEFEIPKDKLVDEFGQVKKKNWTGKVTTLSQLKGRLDAVLYDSSPAIPGRNIYGGSRSRVLKEGTGFFSKIKKDGRWYLTDPSGCMFFSMGPDCVRPEADGRVDGLEELLDYMPEKGSTEYDMFVTEKTAPYKELGRSTAKLVSYPSLNLYRIWGNNWRDNWEKLILKTLADNGMNTLGNWSDSEILGKIPMPYVTSLPQFPDTELKIFRDFPDVFSPEYSQQAEICAQGLHQRKNDPLMIGYFLRNEPGWAFVDNLIIADEVLRSPLDSCCKASLIEYLSEKYQTIDALNTAYNLQLSSFESLKTPIENVSQLSEAAMADMRSFSRKMLRAYVEIPSAACRKVDPNHMILGMRWAWISDPDLVSGWENFDVFSINCYAVDPTPQIENVRKLGVDLPVMIGEFHFGALDAGPTATGLEAVTSQAERGKAYQYYCERVAAHPYGVGCHYFQLYDQFFLGRFDGENYNIGLMDICSQPYSEMMDYVYACSKRIYKVATCSYAPAKAAPKTMPMIAY